MTRENETMRNYILSVMVNNHFGVLTRISGLSAVRSGNAVLPFLSLGTDECPSKRAWERAVSLPARRPPPVRK